LNIKAGKKYNFSDREIQGGKEMYTKILAPLDGSQLAECTIEHVKEIAKGCNIPEVIFLFVVDFARNAWMIPDDTPDARVIEQVVEAERERGAEYLAKVVDAAKKDGVEAKGVVMEGSPADSVIDYAEKSGVDLIVMSTHGRSGVTRFALGSVTDKVIRTVSAPVMVISPAECRVKI
jgi:nucleotide-binding universal stress UspA family protein